jgi:hypothetical protein
MPSAPGQFDHFGEEELPDALVAELRGMAMRNVPAVPATLDAAILSEAKAGFARRSRFRRAARVAVGVAAAAAAAVIAIALPLMHQSDREGTLTHAPVATQLLSVMPGASEDVDHSGKVDILDAFVVAKLVETGKRVDATYDFNGDGKVDQSDVDRIARTAVAVAVAPPHSAKQRRVQ